MTALGELAGRYVVGRRQRGEITTGTARNISCHLADLVESYGDRPVSHLSRAAIERWQASIGHLAPATRRHRLSSVRSFCRWLAEHKHVPRDATVGIPTIRQPRRVPRALPRESVVRLLAFAPDRRATAIVWLMVGLGLRCGEVAGLELADYDDEAGTLLVTGKFGNQRLLPIPLEAQIAITAYLVTTGHVAGPLIRSYQRRSSGLAPATVSEMLSRWMTSAGVKVHSRDGVSAHALRHTAASDVLDRSHDLRVVQEMLGHAQLSTTAIYLRRAGTAKLREAMEGRSYAATLTDPSLSCASVLFSADGGQGDDGREPGEGPPEPPRQAHESVPGIDGHDPDPAR